MAKPYLIDLIWKNSFSHQEYCVIKGPILPCVSLSDSRIDISVCPSAPLLLILVHSIYKLSQLPSKDHSYSTSLSDSIPSLLHFLIPFTCRLSTSRCRPLIFITLTAKTQISKAPSTRAFTNPPSVATVLPWPVLWFSWWLLSRLFKCIENLHSRCLTKVGFLLFLVARGHHLTRG